MRIFLTGLFFFILFAIPSRWYFVCKIRNNCGVEQPVQPERDRSLVLMDGDSTILEGYEEFAFDTNAVQPIMTDDNEAFLAAVAAYLDKHSDKNLTIRGQYLPSEEGKPSGIFDNLGIARAAMLETLLEKLGIDEERMSIDYELIDGNELRQPLKFSLYTPEETADAFEKLQFRFEDMTFSESNFELNKAEFKPEMGCLNYLDSLNTFFQGDAEGTFLVITGHTDSTGTEAHNFQLGMDRANNTAQFIKENYDIEADIKTESMGETQPVAPNSIAGKDNPDGRQKNRRVNFRLVQKDIEQ